MISPEDRNRLNDWATVDPNDEMLYRPNDRSLAFSALLLSSISELGKEGLGFFAYEDGCMELESTVYLDGEPLSSSLCILPGDFLSSHPREPKEDDPIFWAQILFRNEISGKIDSRDLAFDDISAAISVSYLLANDLKELIRIAIECSSTEEVVVVSPQKLTLNEIQEAVNLDLLNATVEDLKKKIPLNYSNKNDSERLEMVDQYLRIGSSAVRHSLDLKTER